MGIDLIIHIAKHTKPHIPKTILNVANNLPLSKTFFLRFSIKIKRFAPTPKRIVNEKPTDENSPAIEPTGPMFLISPQNKSVIKDTHEIRRHTKANLAKKVTCFIYLFTFFTKDMNAKPEIIIL
jgi:hypothetical protein